MNLRIRALRWTQLFAEFSVNQGFGQAVGLISGLIYVRVMPVEQYALYALFLSGLAFISQSSDLGLTGSIGYFWRERHLGEPINLDEIVSAVRRLRTMLFLCSGTIVGAMLLRSAVIQNLAFSTIAACLILLIATAWLQVHVTVDLLLVRIENRFRPSYYCKGAGSFARLVMALAMIATGITTAAFGLLGGLCGAMITLGTLRSFAGVPKSSVRASRATWRSIFIYIGPTLPTMFVYMAQDPLIYWLAFTAGGQIPLSEVFAVGRIAAIYGIVGSFTITVVSSRLVRIQDQAHFAKMAALTMLALALMCCAVLALAYFAPSALLFIIGPKYEHLHNQVFLSVLSSSIGVVSAFAVMINRMQGLVRLEPIAAAVQLLSIFLLVPHWPFTDSESVLKLLVLLTTISAISILTTSVLGLLFPRLVKA